MDATLAFFYVPVQDIKRVEVFYREKVGLAESWREGATTVAFKLPGTELDLVLDQVEDESLSAGPVLQVNSVADWYQSQLGRLDFTAPPSEVPGGSWVIARDASGSVVYFADQQDAGLTGQHTK